MITSRRTFNYQGQVLIEKMTKGANAIYLIGEKAPARLKDLFIEDLSDDVLKLIAKIVGNCWSLMQHKDMIWLNFLYFK